MLQLFYTNYISVDIAHHEVFCAKDGKGGISMSLLIELHFLSIRKWM